MDSNSIANFNIGLLGHVDSGKTTLARVLSEIASTAAFDKNPQSQERGITLDLGFSALVVDVPTHVKAVRPELQQMQFTFVDCPGHASLIRTIIGGAQIIDLMILVIDAQKGIQTQTAECIIIGELLQRKLLVVVNKIDLLPEPQREQQLAKLNTKLRKTLARTAFGENVPIFNVSAQERINVPSLLDGICAAAYLPARDTDAPLLMHVDHCFAIKGQGTVCTGTIVQGRVAVNDLIELPAIHEQRKVKSMQMFHRPVASAVMGDRLGLCVTQFNAKLFERGVLAAPGYLQPTFAACISVQRIRYYKQPVRSKSKLHVTVGHQTVMAQVTLFRCPTTDVGQFDCTAEYEYVEEMEPKNESSSESGMLYALLEFESAIFAAPHATLIASKLDMDAHSTSCRLACWGHMQWATHNANYATTELPQWRVYKRKSKEGSVQRVANERQIIVQNLFSKLGNRDAYVGKRVELSTGECGVIESTFGQTSKVKINFDKELDTETLALLRGKRAHEVRVLLKFKKYIFNKNCGIIQ